MANVQQPDQEAVSKEEPSVLLHSRESVTALTLHMSMPVNSYQAYSLPGSNAELEFRLCWKPPDTKEGLKRHAYHAVSNRMRPSAIKHLPSPGSISAAHNKTLACVYCTGYRSSLEPRAWVPTSPEEAWQWGRKMVFLPHHQWERNCKYRLVEVTVSSEIRPQEPLLVIIEMTLHQLLWNKLSLGGGGATHKSVNSE